MHPPWTSAAVSDATWSEIEREALRVNDRYLQEVIEGHAFCPFAKEGRREGHTTRFVFRRGAHDADALLELFARVAAQKEIEVAQVILPLVEVSSRAFSDFCYELSEEGNRRLPKPALACAPLHPELPFNTASPYALVPLFRRAPDPTIQWVRLDALDALYKGRTSGTVCPTPEELARLRKGEVIPPQGLYDRVCETNARLAQRLGIEQLVAVLSDIAQDGKRSYARLLAGSEASPLPLADGYLSPGASPSGEG